MSKRGVDFLEEATNGPGSTTLPPAVEEIREKVSEAFEEIILFGSRVRPLSLDNKAAGFVRGVSFSEKGWLTRMHPDPSERTMELIKLATNLQDPLIKSLSGIEVRRLLIMITKMSRADNALIPWAYPFSTTSSSERLKALDPFPVSPRFPGGIFHPLTPSDAFIQWKFLASIRTESKETLRGTSNAAMVVQAMVGKGAQQLTSDIKNAQKSLANNVAEPWFEMGVVDTTFDSEDGWGHIHQDQSVEGLMREYWGMVNEDKHEQLMKEMALQHRAKAEAERARIQMLQGRVEGISYREKSLTDKEVRSQEAERQKQERAVRDRNNQEMLEARESASDSDRREDRVWDIEL